MASNGNKEACILEGESINAVNCVLLFKARKKYPWFSLV